MCQYVCLQKSSLTLALKKDFCFISSFPGFFLFGIVDKNHYEKNKFFQFSHFELPQLYKAVLKMIHFMADETVIIEKTEVIQKHIQNCDVTYFILGNSDANEKIVKFCLEVNSVTFELSLTYFELNDFLYCITDIVIASLCLQPIEKEMIQNISLEPLENLILYENCVNAKNYILMHYEKNICSAVIENMTTILVHYNFVIIILHKFKSLVNKDMLMQNVTSSLISIDAPLS